MQEIIINELIMSPPSDYKLDLKELLSKLEQCFSRLFTITSDIDVVFKDADSISLRLEGVNEKAYVKAMDEWVGDPECCYGAIKRICIEGTNFIDKEDIKRAVKKEFSDWDIDASDITCQSKEDVYEEECA